MWRHIVPLCTGVEAHVAIAPHCAQVSGDALPHFCAQVSEDVLRYLPVASGCCKALCPEGLRQASPSVHGRLQDRFHSIEFYCLMLNSIAVLLTFVLFHKLWCLFH